MPLSESHPAVVEVRRLWRPLAVTVALAAWFSTWHAPSAVAAVVHYGAILTMGAVLIFWLASLSQRRHLVLGTGLTALAVALTVYLWRDTCIVRWEDRNQSHYDDTQWRLGGGVTYRRVERLADEGLAWSEGPVEQGEPHGPWIRRESRPPRTVPIWYWQGKPVSEAEWTQRAGR